MAKNIITVGFDLPGGKTKYTSLKSKLSLLDFDISVFDPDIGPFYGYYDDYLGKPCLNDENSFQLKEHLEHWRREILEVIKAGKTVFILLNELEEVYVATGQKSHSGTGRNRQTTRHVDIQTNYSIVPGGIEVINSKGQSMRLNGSDNILSTYWSELGEFSEYRVLISGQGVKPLLKTKTGDKIVGSCLRYKNASGALILLPYIDFEREGFTEYREDEDKVYWTDAAEQAGARFISSVVGIDKAIRENIEKSITPEWVSNENYTLPEEQKIQDKLLTIETKLESLQKDKEALQQSLSEETLIKDLLYEKGKPLENAVRRALTIIGFEVSHHEDEESEFDVVFESSEGRLIGEVEGKDNKSVNIDKLRQLEMNIHEDFAREEIDDMAKGALIGNAFRLLPPVDRGECFTQKCLTAADRSSTALICSIDLFYISKYLCEKSNKTFAKKCRQAILNSTGVVEFPAIPQEKKKKEEVVADD